MKKNLCKKLVFYPAFFFRGQKVWREVEKFKETQFLEPERLNTIQLMKFKGLLAFAYENIEFYRKKYDESGFRPDDVESYDDIKAVPVLEKHEIAEKSREIYNRKYTGMRFERATSGSSGTPLKLFKDASSMAAMDGILYRNYSWYDVDIGDKQGRFWGHPVGAFQHQKLRLLDRMLNRLRLSPYLLSGDKFDGFLKQLRRFKPRYLYGYAQSIFQFANYFHERDVKLRCLNLKVVILTGEMIFPEQINIIKRVFCCDVTEEYGCTEVGVIGFRCHHGSMHLMENLMVEVEGESEGRGEGNIIVSELHGTLFPLIRYKIGDRGQIGIKRCPCGRGLKVLDKLSGRKDDFIKCPDGELIDAYLLEYIIDEMPSSYGKITHFRIVQTRLEKLDIYLAGAFDHEKVDNYFQYKFKNVLPDKIGIALHVVPFIEKERSGKQRCFISELS